MSLGEIMLSFMTSVVGGLMASIVIFALIERRRRPKLLMKICKPHLLGGENDALKRPFSKNLCVRIYNERTPAIINLVYDRSPAFACRAWISFYHLDGSPVYDREMTARWSDTSQPEFNSSTIEGRTYVTPKKVQETYDIPAGRSTEVHLLIRYKDDEECYGWSNESYIVAQTRGDWRNPYWKLSKGRYIVKIRVETNGREFEDAFMVFNDVPFDDYRLGPLSNDLKSIMQPVTIDSSYQGA